MSAPAPLPPASCQRAGVSIGSGVIAAGLSSVISAGSSSVAVSSEPGAAGGSGSAAAIGSGSGCAAAIASGEGGSGSGARTRSVRSGSRYASARDGGTPSGASAGRIARLDVAAQAVTDDPQDRSDSSGPPDSHNTCPAHDSATGYGLGGRPAPVVEGVAERTMGGAIEVLGNRRVAQRAVAMLAARDAVRPRRAVCNLQGKCGVRCDSPP